jgi:hypothetical protein
MAEVTSGQGPIMVSKILDMGNVVKSSVTNDHGENLGRIESLMLDLETGKIAFAILSIGGFPNRTKLFAAPWELLTFSFHDKKMILNVPRDLMIKAPGYDTIEQVIQTADFSWLGEVYEYYSNKVEWQQKRVEERNAEIQKAQQKKEAVRHISSTSTPSNPT